MFEMYFVGQIRRFRCGGSDRFGKIGRSGLASVMRKNVAPEYWMYVPNDTNPADVTTTSLLYPNAFVSCEM